MRFWIERTSDYQGKKGPPVEGRDLAISEEPRRTRYIIEVESPEDMVALSVQVGTPLIVMVEEGSDLPTIEIYDNWRE